MRFQGFIEIDQSIDIVAKLFSDPNLIGKYQEGFVKKELESGEMGKPGAVSKLHYKNGKHEMVLTETVITNDLPHLFEAKYQHKHMDNTMRCEFLSLGEKKTRYKVEVEYTRINWVMPRLFAILFPSMYKKPARKWMENFKRLSENQKI